MTDVEERKRQLLKELGNEDSDSGSSEEEQAGSDEDEDDGEDYDDVVIHKAESDDTPKAAPPWATMTFGRSFATASADAKRRSTLGDISSVTLERERQKIKEEASEQQESASGEQPKLRSWAVRRAAMGSTASSANTQKSEKTDNNTTQQEGGGEQPKLRSWATRRTATTETKTSTPDGDKKESEETKQTNAEGEEASSASGGEQPKMRSWASRKGASSGGYTSLSQLAEKYANLKQQTEKAAQTAKSSAASPTTTTPTTSNGSTSSPIPTKKTQSPSSPPSSLSPLAASSKKPVSPPPKAKASPTAVGKTGSPGRKTEGGLDTLAADGGGAKKYKAIHGSLSRASQKSVHEELLRQQEHYLQKKREKRAKYRAKQKIKRLEQDEKKREQEEKLKAERKKDREKRLEEQILEETESKLVGLEKKLREMVEELARAREARVKAKNEEREKEEGKETKNNNTKAAEANKIMGELAGTWFTDVSTWNEERLLSLEALQSFWVACKKILKESQILLKLDLSCFIFITFNASPHHPPPHEGEKGDGGEKEGEGEEAEKKRREEESLVLQKTLKEVISKKFNPDGEEGGIGVSSVVVEDLDVAKKFWASFDRFWDAQFFEKLKGEKKLKGLASTEEVEKKLKVVRTLAGMLLWDYSLSLLRDPKYITAKFSGIEGMNDITFFVGRPHNNTHTHPHPQQQEVEEEQHWTGVLWGK